MEPPYNVTPYKVIFLIASLFSRNGFFSSFSLLKKPPNNVVSYNVNSLQRHFSRSTKSFFTTKKDFSTTSFFLLEKKGKEAKTKYLFNLNQIAKMSMTYWNHRLRVGPWITGNGPRVEYQNRCLSLLIYNETWLSYNVYFSN